MSISREGQHDKGSGVLKQGIVAFVAVVIVMVWGGYGLIVWTWFPDWQHAGVFGDAFGALNALFSGLAFLIITFTLVMQHDGIGRAEERHQQLLAAHKFAIELQSKTSLLDSYQRRLKWAADRDMKQSEQDLMLKILDLEEQLETLAEGASHDHSPCTMRP